MPLRNPTQIVKVTKCQPDQICLDASNAKKLLSNEVTTEIYIKQLQNIIKELAEPVKP